jgi:uncharacterized protein
MGVVLMILALIGHAVVWVSFVNRLHATRISGRWRHGLTLVAFALMFLGGVAFLVWLFSGRPDLLTVRDAGPGRYTFVAYVVACWLAVPLAVVSWVRRHILWRPPDVLRYHRTRIIRLPEPNAKEITPQDEHHFLVHLPGNQILDLDLADRALELPGLPDALDRLRIVHLSDFHLTGRVGKSYFQEVVRLANEFQPDLVCITGDLIDKPRYIDWLPDTLGRLAARYGVYFILGNHDLKAGEGPIRRTLTESGLIDLGGRWLPVEIRGQTVILAGNELPWFSPAPETTAAPARSPAGPPRFLLSHSPDQLPWAQANEFDLLLAGHTHGGQIRLPWLGPIFTPSRTGVKFSSGTFFAAPTTMHVTRGVSGEFPVRIHCPPEMTLLVLHAPGK